MAGADLVEAHVARLGRGVAHDLGRARARARVRVKVKVKVKVRVRVRPARIAARARVPHRTCAYTRTRPVHTHTCIYAYYTCAHRRPSSDLVSSSR